VPAWPPATGSGAPTELQWDLQRGVPFSPRFGDIYHSEAGALQQSRYVFMQGCEVQTRWRHRDRFCIVETGFGLGLNFMATWLEWLADDARCAHLHLVSLEAYPVTPADILRAVARSPSLAEVAHLASQLAAVYPQPAGPGLHRMLFVHPRDARHCVTLTLVVGDAAQWLPRLQLQADAAYLDGFSPARNPDLWQPRVFKGLARLMRPQALLATWTIAAAVRKGLTEAGFVLQRRPGLPPKRDALQGRLVPWRDRAAHGLAAPAAPALAPPPPPTRRRALVIGAGLAGAACCWALARRGWSVTLLDAASGPAQGASGLPVGLCLPHVSPDDALISRLSRAGVAWMRQTLALTGLPAAAWQSGEIWQALPRQDSASSRHADDDAGLPATDGSPAAEGAPVFVPDATLPGGYRGAALRHAQGLRIQGAALVAHWLAASPGLTMHWHQAVAALRPLPTPATPGPAAADTAPVWQALDAQGRPLAEAELVVVATAMDSLRLLDFGTAPDASALAPVRGQITLGRATGQTPAPPLTGNGHFIGNWPGSASAARWDWAMGSSFERGDTDMQPRPSSDLDNLAKLQSLAPEWAQALAPQFGSALQSREPGLSPWVQIRATTPDRLPLAGPLPDLAALGTQRPGGGLRLSELPRLAGLYTLSGLGARGLSLAALCAEHIASHAGGDPWPIERQLADAVDPARWALQQNRRPHG